MLSANSAAISLVSLRATLKPARENMTRGLLVLVLQFFVCVAVFSIGLWTLLRPKSFQQFLNVNFGLLPAARSGIALTPVLIRLSSAFFLWYGYQLGDAFSAEIFWLIRLVSRLVGQ